MTLRFKTSFMALALGLITPVGADAANFCLAVNGGFGHGGYTYVAPSFTVPAINQCAAWSGFTKTGATTILISNGSACLSNSGRALNLSIFSTDPFFFGTGATNFAWDSILLCLTSGCPFSSQDTSSSVLGGGNAQQVACTPSLLKLPENHQ